MGKQQLPPPPTPSSGIDGEGREYILAVLEWTGSDKEKLKLLKDWVE